MKLCNNILRLLPGWRIHIYINYNGVLVSNNLWNNAGLIPRTLGPFNIFILLNGWICLHGVLDKAGS